MSDCDHCWHTSHSLTMNPPISVKVCCHCGSELRERPMAPDESEHGPFKPGTGSFKINISDPLDTFDVTSSDTWTGDVPFPPNTTDVRFPNTSSGDDKPI